MANTSFRSLKIFHGFIYKKNNIVFCKLDRDPFDEFKLFDFSMKVNSCEKIYWQEIYLSYNSRDTLVVEKNYNLILKYKFYDSTINDTVYHFEFENFGQATKEDDPNFFVSLKYGVLGSYLEIKPLTYHAVKPAIINIKGNIYKDLFDYSRYDFGYKLQ